MGSGNRIAVLGAGSWGTALAILLARNGMAVRLWGHEPDHVGALRRERENRHFLPGFELPPSLEPVGDLAGAVAGADEILVVVPSQAFSEVVARIAGLDGSQPAALSWPPRASSPAAADCCTKSPASTFPTPTLR